MLPCTRVSVTFATEAEAADDVEFWGAKGKEGFARPRAGCCAALSVLEIWVCVASCCRLWLRRCLHSQLACPTTPLLSSAGSEGITCHAGLFFWGHGRDRQRSPEALV